MNSLEQTTLVDYIILTLKDLGYLVTTFDNGTSLIISDKKYKVVAIIGISCYASAESEFIQTKLFISFNGLLVGFNLTDFSVLDLDKLEIIVNSRTEFIDPSLEYLSVTPQSGTSCKINFRNNRLNIGFSQPIPVDEATNDLIENCLGESYA